MIRLASHKDLEGIQKVIAFYGLSPMPSEMIQDLVLVSERGGKIVGVIWAGICQSRIMAYVDYLTVLPEAKGDGVRLSMAIIQELKKREVKKVNSRVALVSHDFQFQSYRINQRLGMIPQEEGYASFWGEVERLGYCRG